MGFSFFIPILSERGVMPDVLSSMQLCAYTDATYRQLDYWCRGGVVSCIGDNMPGSGHSRQFDPAIIPAVRLLVKVSHNFHSLIRLETLKIIFDNYKDGKADFDGLTLTWEV